MGTRSRIGIQNKNGTFTTIYCYWDGYLSWVGNILQDHYTTEEKIKELINLGSLSSLGKEIGEKHSFEESMGREQCTAFHRDRGEDMRDVRALKIKDLNEWVKERYEQYNYFFREGEWWMFKLDDLETLSTVKIELAFEKQKKKADA